MIQAPGPVVAVTGAGQGIGRALARAFAQQGARVVVSDIDAMSCAAAASELQALGVPADVTNAEHCAALVARAVAVHGRLDVMICNAGINFPKRYWCETDGPTFEQVVAVNLNGATYCTRAVAKGMRERREGTVINVASFAGWHYEYLTGPAYTASKAALMALTHSFNIEECVNGLRATALCPGEVATPILKKRPVQPSEADKARMLQEADLGRTIRFIAEMPPHVCINELVISPVWNRTYVAGEALQRKAAP
jgi:NAD(P)-dependent dehydrogenase (short-subunit alcohol dehydrogenase family)